MRPHSFDPLSFFAGLVFCSLGILGAAGGLSDLETLRIGWPLVVILLGVLLVGSSINRAARTDEPGQGAVDEPADEAVDEPVDEMAFADPAPDGIE